MFVALYVVGRKEIVSKRERETWWDETVESLVKQKRKLWKEWQKEGSKEKYLDAKSKAKSGKNVAKEKFSQLESSDGKNFIFKLAKRMKRETQDIVGDKCVKNDEGCLTYNDSAKVKARKSYYERLLNVEFMWNSDSFSDLNPKIGPPLYITEEMISKAIAKMKTGKAAGPSGIVIEMIRSAGKEIIKSITNLADRIIKEGCIPSDWNLSYIVSLCKGKGDALSRHSYRGLKLLDQVMKIIERVLDSVIRSQVDIDSMQFGFIPGRGITDAIFILRQLQEKHLGKHKPLYFDFVALEKAFDRVPRKVL